jgi:hypothetical protein
MNRYRTPAEDVWIHVQQAYFSRGKKVPLEEAQACKEDIRKEALLNAYYNAKFFKRVIEEEYSEKKKDLSYVEAAEYIGRIAEFGRIIQSTPPELIPPEPKASYGSSGFWKDYWAKKKAKGWVSVKEAATKEAEVKAKAAKAKAKA